jgi:ADP-ribose pyrophosphatase
MKSWKTLSNEIILDQRPWLLVEQRKVELPDGRLIPNWPWVTTPDYINVVVEMQNGRFLCFRQVKYGLPEPTLALVGGYIEPGEMPLAAAQRELAEETGCISDDWIELGHFLVDPNRGMATGHLYLARGCRALSQPIPDDLEEQEWLFLSTNELAEALQLGEFKVLAWAAAVSLALRLLEDKSL